MGSSRSSVLSPPAPRLGSDTPRVFTPPLRKLTPKTSLGFALIEFAEDVLGIDLYPWQKWLAIHSLELLPDGTFRFRTVLLLVARQNGKSTFLQILALFFLYVRGVALVIGTAQNLDIAEEVWQGAVDIAQDVPDLAAEIERVVMVNGKKALELRRGERYKVQAANRRGGRGLSGDLVLLDELREHQTWDAWGAVTKTTMARPLAQTWAASNAGDGSSMVLKFLRGLAHEAVGDPDGLADQIAASDDDIDDESLGIFEWSAPPGCGLDDREGWAQANPSLGHAIFERAISSARRTDPEHVFRTEVLCQWVDSFHVNVIRLDRWATCEDAGSTISEPQVFAFDVTPGQFDRSASVAIAGTRSDGLAHVEIMRSDPGTGWLPALLVELRAKYPNAKIVGDPTGPAGSVFTDAKALGVEIEAISGREYAQACGSFHDAVVDLRMRHRPDAVLDAALLGASKRDVGDGAWTWSRKSSQVNIAPLVAATLALAAVEPEVEADFFTI